MGPKTDKHIALQQRNTSFRNMKRLSVFLLLPGWDASSSPCHPNPHSLNIEFAAAL